jgi:hypothetical protein
MDTRCHCREDKNGVFATILTLDNQEIAKGILKLGSNRGHGSFLPKNLPEYPVNIEVASYPEVLARVETLGSSHFHKLYDWWFHEGLSHRGGRPSDPDHYHFVSDSE